MAFQDYELSIESGRPIRLYRFTLGDTIWRYTSADEDLTIAGQTWKRVSISDDGIKQSGESVTDALSIEASISVGPAQIYMTSPPSRPIECAILTMHEGMAEPVVAYLGDIIQVNYPMPGVARITVQTIQASMRRSGLRLSYQRSCPYALYDPVTCKVNKADFAQACTIQSIDGFTITATNIGSAVDGRYTGGILQWEHPIRGVQFVFVERHAGASLVIFGETADLFVGQIVTLYPGCARTTAACNSFSNIANYGGFPFMPGKSPFNGASVFY